MAMHLRAFQPGDEQGIFQAYKQSIQILCAEDYPEQIIKVWAARDPDWCIHAIHNQGATFHVLENQTEIIGFSGWRGDRITELYIRPDYALQGFGTKLLHHTEKDFWSRSGQDKCVLTSTITAKPFYEKRGFTADNLKQLKSFQNPSLSIPLQWDMSKNRPSIYKNIGGLVLNESFSTH